MNLSLRDGGKRVAGRVMLRVDDQPTYTNDLMLEGMLWWYDAMGDSSYLEYVFSVINRRGWNPGKGLSWENQPFVCIHFNLYLQTGDSQWLARFVEVANDFRARVPRSTDGAVAFADRPETGRIYVDYLQNYATWMARAGWLSDDRSFFDEAVTQYQLYRDALRDPKTGLWSQGRGWGTNRDFVSPLGWLRGQGWILRGMVETLTYLPGDHSGHERMRAMLKEFTRALVGYQDRRGMWHEVPHRMDSYQETTGTGFITHYFYRAIAQGFLDDSEIRMVAGRAAEALPQFITRDGTVLNGSSGCGPLFDAEHYLHRDAPPGEAHTTGTMLMGLSGPFMLTAAKSKMSLWRTLLKDREGRAGKHEIVQQSN